MCDIKSMKCYKILYNLKYAALCNYRLMNNIEKIAHSFEDCEKCYEKQHFSLISQDVKIIMDYYVKIVISPFKFICIVVIVGLFSSKLISLPHPPNHIVKIQYRTTIKYYHFCTAYKRN